ncbi:KxYKxGKxW signal peptide domain-containing protein [Weissella confusa]|uniref:Amidase n=1 Tax=Weissella confusa TaxID=1583 RepID=A0A4Z0RYI5_WEICO|nr:KxYKxGKxW signal peptide domain-containing protein [Weissella confusa]TGE75281.1 amidase [Weissella confusa]
MQNVNSRKKMYKSGKNWVAATVVAAAAAIVPMISTESAYANEEVAQTTSSWRAKTVDQVVEAVQAAGQKYTVQAGDTLSMIASATELTAEEIAAANNINDANFIVIGQEINLTKEVAEEVVASEAPVAEEAAVEVAPVVEEAAPVATEEVAVEEAPVAQEAQPAAPSYNADYTAVPGNSYYAGQCTWYVKNQLPWVGNFWGNAAEWANNATYAGRVVDTNPAVGTVAVMMPGVAYASSYGHVAVVTGVNGDMITISEMNAKGEFVVSSRTIPAAGVLFIH